MKKLRMTVKRMNFTVFSKPSWLNEWSETSSSDRMEFFSFIVLQLPGAVKQKVGAFKKTLQKYLNFFLTVLSEAT